MERHVRVDRVDHPIAVPPGVGPVGVDFEAVGVCIMHQVEPVLSPTHAKLLRRQQAIDQSLVGVGSRIRQEGSQFIGCWGQPCEVEGEPAAERGTIGLGRGLEIDLLERFDDECVDRILDSLRVLDRRGIGSLDGLKGPVIELLGLEFGGRGGGSCVIPRRIFGILRPDEAEAGKRENGGGESEGHIRNPRPAESAGGIGGLHTGNRTRNDGGASMVRDGRSDR